MQQPTQLPSDAADLVPARQSHGTPMSPQSKAAAVGVLVVLGALLMGYSYIGHPEHTAQQSKAPVHAPMARGTTGSGGSQ
ncbi:MAG TPA: hypothetical protein VFB45_03760 [Pseudolabrys sp.]|nr:hypothetical protein [Pseudolabrys sp.]